jgi:mono/diheme cytochrome c family protein
MKRAMGGVLILAAALLVAGQPASGPRRDGTVERGRYLVDGVAQCPECHTPRDSSGTLIPGQYLEGAPVPVKSPPFPNLRWAFAAPAIRGLPGFTQEEIVKLLTEGMVVRTGQPPTPPMPRFRMSPEDARAVFAYLKSLR